jgi:peptide-methionine (S)-S-oxide reductase
MISRPSVFHSAIGRAVRRMIGRAILILGLIGTAAVLAQPAKLPAVPPGAAIATFAGGCFWCMEAPFDKLDGVLATTSGYTGGTKANPTYEEVSSGDTGHAEAVQVLFDPKKVSYEKLLDVFWHNVDPTVKDRQFCDVGTQYRSAIFYQNAEQRAAAEASKAAIEKSKTFKEAIVTPIVMATQFWPAEEYHQDYYVKNPIRYNYYRTGCGRDARLKQLWGSASH